MDRRTFVQRGALAASALALPDLLLRDPLAPLAIRRGGIVRVTGRVTAQGRGVKGVAVSDGASVTTTDATGRYTLLADSTRPFVFMSPPSGYRVPVSPAGTAYRHRPLVATSRGEMTAEFPLERQGIADEDHSFVLLADIQTQNAFEMGRLHAETVPDVRRTLASLGDRPSFGIACGDIMFDDLSLYPEYERAVRAMGTDPSGSRGTPFFQVIGNHDLVFDKTGDGASGRTFERHFGPTYYSFDRGEIHYVVLDDVFWHGQGYLGYLDDLQQRWLAADLANVERGRTVVVFVHIPALSTLQTRTTGARANSNESVTNREVLYRLLEPYKAFVLSGHTHEHERHRDGGVRHHVHGTVCGAWWSGDICWDGTPNGYAVYDARGSELRWRYQSTGQPAEHQMRIYPPGSDPLAPQDVVANIWDADESWTVRWFEDGAVRGLMSRRLGLDPRAVELHTGADKPPRRTWVEPVRTNHLYYAAATPGAREVRVEATDTWGKRYSAALTLGVR